MQRFLQISWPPEGHNVGRHAVSLSGKAPKQTWSILMFAWPVPPWFLAFAPASVPDALRPSHFCWTSGACFPPGEKRPVRCGGVSPQKVLGAPPAHRRPPAVLVLSTAVLAAPRQGEPVFSKVRFLVLWVVAVWSLLNIETPWDFGGIFFKKITLRKTFFWVLSILKLTLGVRSSNLLNVDSSLV